MHVVNRWRKVVNLHLWLCEAEGCKEIAGRGHHRGDRLDLYCEKHALELQELEKQSASDVHRTGPG